MKQHPMIAKKEEKYAKILQVCIGRELFKREISVLVGGKNSNLGEILKNLVSAGNLELIGGKKHFDIDTASNCYKYTTINPVYLCGEMPDEIYGSTLYHKVFPIVGANPVTFSSKEMCDKLLAADKLRASERKSPEAHICSLHGAYA